MRARHFAPLLLICISLTGCGGDGEPKASDCMRAEGVSWYPDPDPVTGEFTDRGLTPEQRASLKRNHADALRKCMGR
ncbi:hypothetical protein [Streptomyces sp. NPDC059874]|uniref:hypothetical protein n=1 Tax=Streptomyces sp. NPDC059874 TaxID=3346983 RepID=UPI00365A7448